MSGKEGDERSGEKKVVGAVLERVKVRRAMAVVPATMQERIAYTKVSWKLMQRSGGNTNQI